MICLEYPANIDWKARATTDPLTGLHSRLSLELTMAQSSDYVLFLLDLNKFKPINDTAGHDKGDRVLKAIADSLRSKSGCDLVARWGGDEFVALVQCDESDIPGIYKRLKDTVQNTPLDECLPPNMHGHRCGVAIGWALSTEGDALKLADQRMYEDKNR
jgi:diguanylate cyclase (GGDEF)-like protein